METLIVAEKRTTHGLLLVVTDTEILGKKFEQGKLQLDLTSDFYAGQEKSADQVRTMLQDARYVHFTGQSAVRLGIEEKLIDTQKVLLVRGVPHAEVVQE